MKASLGGLAALIWCLASPASAQNLVTNPDFQAGNMGFQSDYVDRTNGPDGNVNGSYAIGTDAAAVPNRAGDWGGFGDHTTGTGNMFIADGALGRAWFQTISLVAGETYSWSFWAHTVQGNSGSQASLTFQVNDVSVSDPLLLPVNSASAWQQALGSFVALTSGNTRVAIFDTNGSGPFNDFALDDISVVGRTLAVPGPLAGAGLIPLLGLAGAMVARRRREKLAA